MDTVRFASGSLEVEVLPGVGARLHRLRAFGHDLLRTPDDPTAHVDDPFAWGAYVMAPWCNRIEPGRVRVGQQQVEVGSNFPDGSAIHGQVYDRRWVSRGDGIFTTRAGGDGWPWHYEVVQRIEVGDRSLRLDYRLINRSPHPMPGGLGIHPWFIKPVLVAIRGDAVHPMNAGRQGPAEPVEGPFDLRGLRSMGPDLDATWTSLAPPQVELRWPVTSVAATMRITAPTTYVVAASPADRDAVAVEPQTHAVQGLWRLLNGHPGGLTVLDPGQELTLGVELEFALVAPHGR
ncbi:MAG: hypothetical protein OEW24_00085 [Chloroflexota bacterium]|nr:hypothetical protein [Chloroflexota bacterium]